MADELQVSRAVMVQGSHFRDTFHADVTIGGPNGVVELVQMSDDGGDELRLGIYTAAIPELIKFLQSIWEEQSQWSN